jgi:hypothetical protein
VTETFRVEQGDNPSNPKNYEPDTVASLAPGAYGALTVKSRSTLTLTTGAYGFTSFDLEPQAVLKIDDAAGPVRIYVQNNIIYNGGSIASKSGGQPALLLVQAGTAPIGINATFLGEIVAPSATLTLGPGQTPHIGTFLAGAVVVHPGTIVTHRPYFRLGATPTWGITASTGSSSGTGTGSAPPGPYGVGAFTAAATFVAPGPKGVLSVTSAGATSTLKTTANFSPFVLERSGTRFAIPLVGQVQVFSTSNPATPIFTAPSDGGPVALVPNSNLLYVAQGTFGLEGSIITGAKMYSPSGLTASFSTPGLMLVRVTSTALIWATSSQLISTSLTGVEKWRKNVRLVTYEISANGATLVGLLNSPGSSSIVHVRLSDGNVSAATALSGVFWNLAAAPSGRFTAATTRTGLTIFDSGVVARTADLPVGWANTLDVSDQGYAAVGAQVPPRQGQLVLVGPPGTGTSVTTATSEIDAFRPGVQFAPGGTTLLLNSASSLQAFNVLRTM